MAINVRYEFRGRGIASVYQIKDADLRQVG